MEVTPQLDAELLEEYGVEAVAFARLLAEAQVQVAAGVEGESLDDHLAFFTAGLLKGLESGDGD